MPDTELKANQLYHHCRLEGLPFTTTDDFDSLPPSAPIIGQPRAEQALNFGVGMQRKGYHVFAFGEQGTGKQAFIRDLLEARARREAVPEDICYVANFEQPHTPRLLTLAAGKGKALARDMKRLIEDVRNALRAAFENEEFQNRAQSITDELEQKQKETFEELRKKARERNLLAVPTPSGLAFVPAKEGEEEGLSREEYEKLSEEEKGRIKENAEHMQKEAQRLARNIPHLQREIRNRQKAFTREVTEYTIDPLIDELKEKYADYASVRSHIDAVRDDLVENARDLFAGRPDTAGPQQMAQAFQLQGMAGQGAENPIERRYHVNVLVDHAKSHGAPVVYEENPTYQNLFGRVEHQARMGALVTDVTMIRAGALQRANGGYLLLDALKLVRDPFAWEALKRALRSGRLKIESIGQMYGLISTVSLEPEALPIRIKVVLTGTAMVYYLLRQYDADFRDLFKVPADFSLSMDRTEANEQEFVRRIAIAAQSEKLLPFKRDAVCRVIERGSRQVGDARKMSLHQESMKDLLREADYWARESGHPAVEAAHVDQAVASRIFRSDRLREMMQEQIQRDIVLIDTAGSQVGRVNGLSVISLGDFAFGRPSRITARVHLGSGKVVDIEREVAMGGPIHSKGVLILSGFLGGRFARDYPLALSASLVFEQSYGGVEGDSASSAELYALLSAIADVPVRQNLAVTGSVNQYGQVQPIGGANEKIEGFFDVCKARGLSGEQGVLIPAANVQHLMLRSDVIEAVETGNFHIHAVSTIDQGIEILTGLSAGVADDAGKFPDDSFNGHVDRRLRSLADRKKKFAARSIDAKGDDTGDDR